MKKLYFIIVLSLVYKSLICQSSFDLGLTFNKYTHGYKDYERIAGATLQFGYNYKLNEIFTLKTGLDVNFSKENYYEIYFPYSIDSLGHITFESLNAITDIINSYTINMYIPISLETKLLESNFSLISGLCIGIDNLMCFTEYRGTDPEIGSTIVNPKDYYKTDWPIGRKLCVGQKLGVAYQATERLKLLIEFNSTINNVIKFCNIGVGLSYKLTNR